MPPKPRSSAKSNVGTRSRSHKRKVSESADSSNDETPALAPSLDRKDRGVKKLRIASLSPEVEFVESKASARTSFAVSDSEKEDLPSKKTYPVTPTQTARTEDPSEAGSPLAHRASSSELDMPLSKSLRSARAKGSNASDVARLDSSLDSPFEMTRPKGAAAMTKAASASKVGSAASDNSGPVKSDRNSFKADRDESDSDDASKAGLVKSRHGDDDSENIGADNGKMAIDNAVGDNETELTAQAPDDSLNLVMQARWQDPELASKGFYDDLHELGKRFWIVPNAMYGPGNGTDDGDVLKEYCAKYSTVAKSLSSSDSRNLLRCLAFESFQNFVNPARIDPKILTVDNVSRLKVASLDALAVFVIPGIVTDSDLFTLSVEDKHVRSITVLPFSQEFHRMIALFGYAFNTVAPSILGGTYSSNGLSFVTRNKSIQKPRTGFSSAASSPAKKARTSKFAEETSSVAERPSGARRTLAPALYYTDMVYVFDGRKTTKQFRFTDEDFKNLWTWPQYLDTHGAQKEVPAEAVVAVGFDVNIWGTDKHRLSTNIQFVIVLAD